MKNSPFGIALATIKSYRQSKKIHAFLEKSQWWSEEKIREYQDKQLNTILHHAYDYVPYYTEIFDKLDLKPSDIQSVDDLEKLPFLTREIVRKQKEDIKALNYPKEKFEPITTGGIADDPLEFYVEKGMWLANHLAFVKILMERAGYRFRDKTVSLAGTDRLWRYHYFSRTLVLSTFHMTPENLLVYVKKIRTFKPKYITGYPSAIWILAQFINKNNIENNQNVKAIFCQGETLYDWQRTVIEETFHCKIYDKYGHREQSVLIGTCEYHNYHIFPEYGIVELINYKGKPVTKDGEIGEIVATGLRSHIFPFIRYKTGDLAVYTQHKCKCGRNYPLVQKIEGRVQDFIITKTNQKLPFKDVYEVIVNNSEHIWESQLIQETKGELVLHIVKEQPFSERDMDRLKDVFQKRFGKNLILTIEYVNQIPRTNRGKFQYFIQKLPIDFYEGVK